MSMRLSERFDVEVSQKTFDSIKGVLEWADLSPEPVPMHVRKEVSKSVQMYVYTELAHLLFDKVSGSLTPSSTIAYVSISGDVIIAMFDSTELKYSATLKVVE